MRISEFADIIRRNGLQKKDFSESGIGCIHYGQIYTKFDTVVKDVITYVPSELASKLKRVNPGDLIVAITSENKNDICKCVSWEGSDPIVTGGHAAIIKHHENPRYLSYVFQSTEFNRQKIKKIKGTKVMEMSPDSLGEIVIPLPPKNIQNEIVHKLDAMRSLVFDLTSGIPAGIEARRKQYEYYRDKLLSFEEAQP